MSPKHVRQKTVKPSGVDDAAVIQAAVDALGTGGGKVLFDEGTYTVSRAIRLHPGNTAMLYLEGYGATVKLVGAVGFLTFDRTADYQSFRHFAVDGFDIDATKRKATSGCTIIGGNNSAGGPYYVWRGDVEDIRLSCLHVYGAPSVNTTGCWAVALGTKHRDEREPKTNYVRSILIDDIVIEGGDTGILVAAQLSGATQGLHETPFDMNAVVDDVEVTRVDFRSGRVPPFSGWESNTGIMVNQHGKGGLLRVADCYLQGTGDDLLEINSMREAYVDRIYATETYDLGFQLRNQGMCLDGTQKTVYTSCTYVAGREPRGIGFGFASREVARSSITYTNCKFVHQDGTVTRP